MPNRTLCGVLDEMRKAHKTRNYSYMLGLIEEAQSMGNRMEAGLYDKSDLEGLEKRVKNLRKQRDVLREEIDSLKAEKGEDPDERHRHYLDI